MGDVRALFMHAGKQVGDDCPPIFEKGLAAAVACGTSARLQVFHALFRPIRSTLMGLSKLEVWGATQADSAGSSGFSSPPSEYIHGIAQSLLDVPTMVQEGTLSTAAANDLWEVLAAGALETDDGRMKLSAVRMAGLVQAIDADNEEEQPDEDEADAAYNWLVLVAKGTVAMLLAQVDAMPRLTEAGAAQLAADLSHWTKVLGAGEMEPGPVLLQVRATRVYILTEIAVQRCPHISENLINLVSDVTWHCSLYQAIALLKTSVVELGRATASDGEDADLLRRLCTLRKAGQPSQSAGS